MLIGIVGKPSCGKSTFFKACTLADVAIAAYPFTTIKPNFGVGHVKVECVEKEFTVKCNPRFGYCVGGKRFVPVQLIDVAGLIPGSHAGLGRGNQFLDDLRQADVLIHVVDISGSTNEKGEQVHALSYDPAKDIKFLEYELDMWYYQILKKGWDKFARSVQGDNQNIKKDLAKQLSGLRVTENIVEEAIKKLGLIHHPLKWSEDDLKNLACELRKKTKPMIIAANKIDILGSEVNLKKLIEEFKDYIIIPCSGDSELALREAVRHKLVEYVAGDEYFKIIGKLNEQQEKALDYIKVNVLEKHGSTGVQEVLDKAVFELLKYIAVFPGGVNKLQDSEGRVLPDCFLLPENSTALDFAFKVHQDLGKNFIRAIDVKLKRTVGKDYRLKNLDVIEIVAGK